MTTREKFRKLTTRETVELASFLQEVIEPAGTDECRYKGDWSDERVAAHFGVQASSVRRVRAELYGTIRRGKPEQPSADAAQIETLRLEVAGLREEVEGLKEAVGELEAAAQRRGSLQAVA